MAKKREIRNSTAEFLIFQAENKEQGIEVMYANETIWCTQDAIAALFDKGRSTIAEHLQNAFTTGELEKDSVCRKFRRTAADGKEYNTQYYNLDAIIAVGYRVNSIRATQFRQWATSVLRQYAIRGYVLDKKLAKRVSYSIKDETTYNGEVPPPVKYAKAHEGWKCLLKVHVYFFNDLLLAVDSILFSLCHCLTVLSYLGRKRINYLGFRPYSVIKFLS